MDRGDLDIVQAINDADPIAFKKLFEQHWKKIYHIALQKLPREEDASDITQEVFYLIWKNRGYWKIKTNIEAYLQGMLRHKIYDFYAQRDRLPILIPLNEQEEYWHYSFQEAEREDYSYENQLVRKEIEAMPEKMREIFILGRFENLSAAQISEKLGISVQTVRNQISAALKRLGKCDLSIALDRHNHYFYLVNTISNTV
ncbi:sigma-70 family RNA polymerase sigma factor [Parapedobacter sp. SGR-10]|uniref:RNA polymerase sigma factor n=1 Tax=Parapedobacter sp. SGR-10 TaxID=2710879 RepID=UPI0013D8BB10|nr:sigma-70 family RNA polymerase sigma factor [Parapedobacter sp. SGR-10]NGF57857.1 sigma-70 family RNA polymerase sigma factor [Parapedobacter sp. SGR-10]